VALHDGHNGERFDGGHNRFRRRVRPAMVHCHGKFGAAGAGSHFLCHKRPAAAAKKRFLELLPATPAAADFVTLLSQSELKLA
jgi:hypothetical protein